MASSKNEETIEVWEKDPSIQAFTDLMNRFVDKPAEQEQVVAVKGQIDIVGILQRRKKKAGV